MPTISDYGIETSARMLANVSPAAAFGFIATGTSSQAESTADTGLLAENTTYGAQRAAATVTYTAPGITTWTKLFSFTGPVTVREIALHNSITPGLLGIFCRAVLVANKTFVAGESVEIAISNTLTRQ